MGKLAPGTKLQVGSHEAEIIEYLAEVKPTPIEDGYDTACLKRVLVKSKPELNLLRKEVDTMKKLANNEYVVKYYDSNAQKLKDGTYEVLLLMEYCPNKSLLDLMNQHLKTKLSTAQILKIMFEISIAVSSMHYMNLIHRDLKVENVLINANDDFKLADFGSTSGFIAPPTNQEEFQSIAHDILHQTTPQYRAPEMIDLYKNIPIDYKSDIWALGVFLYKLMYYTTPFEAQGELAILHGYFQFPQTPKYPSRLKNLVIIMLQVDPTLRPNIYQVVHEVGDISKKEIPIEDYYGLGPYNFEEYAKYQQQLQYQQQQIQQQQYQQQQQLQQQKFAEQELLRQRAEVAAVSKSQEPFGHVSGIPEDNKEDENQNQDYNLAPQKLTRSSNPSSGDLQNLENESELELPEKTPDPILRQPTGGSNPHEGSHKEYSMKNVEGKEAYADDDDLEKLGNAEERYPSLEELDEAAVEKRFPDVDDIAIESDPISRGRKSLDNVETGASSRKSVEFARSPSNKSQRQTDISQDYEDENAPKPGIKLSHTEAWVTSGQESNTNDFNVDGVFHRQSSNSAQQQESSASDSTSRKSFEVISKGRKSFESGISKQSPEQSIVSPQDSINQTIPSPPQVHPHSGHTNSSHYSSLNNISYSIPPQPASQYAYPQFPQQQQQQKYAPAYRPSQFQQQDPIDYPQPIQQKLPLHPRSFPNQPYGQFDNASSRNSSRVSRNPFPQQESKNPFPTARSSLEINTQPVKDEKSGGNPWAGYTSPQQGHTTMNQIQQQQPQPQQHRPPIEHYTTTDSIPRVNSNSIHGKPPSIKVFANEKLIDLGDSPKKEFKQPKLNLELLELDMSESGGSTDDLKVEEMNIQQLKKKKQQHEEQLLSYPPVSNKRKSSELSRINLDLEELDLEDESNENAIEESDDKSHRRSLNLSRVSSRLTTTKSNRKDDNRKSSFLGFSRS